jgi:hypothetical protein
MLGRLLVALYPDRWRARYGDELQALIDEEPATPSLVIDVVRGALEARAASSSSGDFAMRTRSPALVSLLAVVLVLPAVTFLTAALVRSLQPTEYQPARAAQTIFDAFAALPPSAVWLLLGLAPLAALGLAVFAAWRRLRDDPAAREDVSAFVNGWRRILRQPALVLAGLAFIASAGVLAFVISHAIAG